MMDSDNLQRGGRPPESIPPSEAGSSGADHKRSLNIIKLVAAPGWRALLELRMHGGPSGWRVVVFQNGQTERRGTGQLPRLRNGRPSRFILFAKYIYVYCCAEQVV